MTSIHVTPLRKTPGAQRGGGTRPHGTGGPSPPTQDQGGEATVNAATNGCNCDDALRTCEDAAELLSQIARLVTTLKAERNESLICYQLQS